MTFLHQFQPAVWCIDLGKGTAKRRRNNQGRPESFYTQANPCQSTFGHC